jgi:hypothetical protein
MLCSDFSEQYIQQFKLPSVRRCRRCYHRRHHTFWWVIIFIHRYLMSRLSLQVFYLWRHVSSTAPPFKIMVVKFRNTILPPPPQLSLHRRAALSSNSNGTRSVYSRDNPKSSLPVYCEMSMCLSWHKETIFWKKSPWLLSDTV